MGFLIEKPQFDTKQLTPGTPIHVKHKGGYPKEWQSTNDAFLVLNSTPLELTLVRVKVRTESSYIDDEEKVIRETEIKILPSDLVANKQIEILPLIKEILIEERK